MIRITPKDAKGMMDAYAIVYAPKEEPKTEDEPKAEAPKEEPKPETEATAETEAPADAEETDK